MVLQELQQENQHPIRNWIKKVTSVDTQGIYGSSGTLGTSTNVGVGGEITGGGTSAPGGTGTESSTSTPSTSNTTTTSVSGGGRGGGRGANNTTNTVVTSNITIPKTSNQVNQTIDTGSNQNRNIRNLNINIPTSNSSSAVSNANVNYPSPNVYVPSNQRNIAVEYLFKDSDLKDLRTNENRIKSTANAMEKIVNESEKITSNINQLDAEIEANRYTIEQWEDSSYIKNGKFIGTKEEYDAYKKDFEKFQDIVDKRNLEAEKQNELVADNNIEIKRLQSLGGNINQAGIISGQTIGVGLYNERQEPVSKFTIDSQGRPLLQASRAYDITAGQLIATSSSGWKDIVNVVGKKMGKKTDMYGNVILRNPSYSKEIVNERIGYQYFAQQGSLQTNQKVGGEYKQVFIPEIVTEKVKRELTTKDLEEGLYKGLTFTSNLAKFSIPYFGMAAYAGETGARVREFGGVKGYITAKPGEVLLTATAVLTPLVIKGYKYLRNKSISDAMKMQIQALSKEKISSLRFVEKEGKIFAIGERTIKNQQGTAVQTVVYEGMFKKTAKGIKMVSKGTGVITTAGTVNPTLFKEIKIPTRQFVLQQTFKWESSGKSFALPKVKATVEEREKSPIFANENYSLLKDIEEDLIYLNKEKTNEPVKKQTRLSLFANRSQGR